MISATWKQLSRFTAILVVALICAQSLAVAHSHDQVDDKVCAICFASSDEGIVTTALDPIPPAARQPVEALPEILEQGIRPNFRPHSRAPPLTS